MSYFFFHDWNWRNWTQIAYNLHLTYFFPWSIGYIYEAFDSQMGRNVALKMEKKDKSKNILKFEYQVLQHLKGQ